MNKNFWKWHLRKNNLHKDKIRANFHEREVWFASLGVNLGFEQDGKGKEFLRPVVVVKKFNNEIFWGIPTTKKEKTGIFYFRFLYKENDSTTAILSQLRLMDSKRLKYQIGAIEENDFAYMKRRIISFLE
jgi:mRNA interferase MazF